MRAQRLSILLVAVASQACSETPVSRPFQSLQRSGDVSFVCVGRDADDRLRAPRNIDQCPDNETDGEDRRMLALVTQTTRGEVAVVDLSAGEVVDSASSAPGFGFLPVGELPRDIVSTPGGVATFVGVADVGKEGIFALPSSCLYAPAADEPPRDLTTWAACALPSAPGEMAVLIDPRQGGLERATCDGPYEEPAAPGEALAADRLCSADLALESLPAGRRKLAVALPDRGELAIIDAQELLDRRPGDFEPCRFERLIRFDTTLPASVSQQVPDDLDVSGCELPGLNHGPDTDEYASRPAGMTLRDGKLWVADLGAPLIHVLDVDDPCSPTELAPLLPASFTDSGRDVVTSDVAVSDVTTTGEQFAYAIDADQGSVMVFDVREGSSNRTPLLRRNSARLPFEPPDRIAFDSPARDLELVTRDEPEVDPITGTAPFGTMCDPRPAANGSPAAEYRPNSSLTSGAAPRNLRGSFGFIALASGQIAVIDVEDYDAPCRRPTRGNTSSEPNAEGCVDDELAFYTESGNSDGTRTVTDEESCLVVEPHRSRSATFFKNSADTGVRSPSLRSFPRLSGPDGALTTDQTDEGLLNPKLLAVPYPSGEPASVYVGSTLYGGDDGQELNTAPDAADVNSIALLTAEPRSFPLREEWAVAYEGRIMNDRPAGFFATFQEEENADLLALVDGGGQFCGRGVQDATLVREVAPALEFDGDIDAFAARYADRLQIVSEIAERDEDWWQPGSAGATCGGVEPGFGYDECAAVFGPADAPTDARDFRIERATNDRLLLRSLGGISPDFAKCCFPSAVSYGVRAGSQWVVVGSATGFRHRVTTGEDGFCAFDCNPLRALNESRAFEIRTTPLEDDETGIACVDTSATSGVSADHPCVFRNLTSQFAVYRGTAQTVRDSVFSYEVTGGFAALFANLASRSLSVSPQSMQFVPQIGQLAVADGASAGLAFISLNSVAVTRLFF